MNFSQIPDDAENHNIVKAGIVPVETKTFSYKYDVTEKEMWPSKI